jgi:superfamily II DNA or RNA helicase
LAVELTLRPDQMEDLTSLIRHNRYLLLGEPGTGKTPPVCIYAQWLWSKKNQVMLLLQPDSIMEKNRDELRRWTDFTDNEVVMLTRSHGPLTRGWNGPTYDRVKKIRHATGRTSEAGKAIYTYTEQPETVKDLLAHDASGAKVLLCGFTFFRLYWQRILRAANVGSIVIDEMHKGFSTADTANTNALLFALEEVERFVGMTGTLIAGRLDSAYPAIAALDPRYYPGGKDTFIAQHAEFIDEYNRVQGWINLDKVKAILNRHASRRLFRDIHGDEAKVIVTELCYMGPQLREAYDKFHAQGMLELADGWLDGTVPGVGFIRCQQLMDHPETLGVAEGEPHGKDERMRLHLEDAKALGQQVVIYANLKPHQDRMVALARECGLRTTLINGDVPINKRGAIDRAFVAGEIDCLVTSEVIADVGFNWGQIDHILIPSIGVSDSGFLQAYRRGIRGKRSKPLRITLFEFANSIDQRKFAIIEEKSTLAHEMDPSREIFRLSAAA